MENKRRKRRDFYSVVRSLHRDLGFLTVGLTIVFALSGSLLVFRDTPFMKVKQTEEMQLASGMDAVELSQHVRVRGFKVESIEGDIIRFNGGKYDAASGKAVVFRMVYPKPVDKLVNLHKVTSKSKMSWIVAIYGFILTFFAVSGMLMFKLGSNKSKRGLFLVGGSIAIAILVVMLA